jgi:hypothetical protein
LAEKWLGCSSKPLTGKTTPSHRFSTGDLREEDNAGFSR